MFNGLADKINAALSRALQVSNEKSGKIEIEFRLGSYESVTNDKNQSREKGVFTNTITEFKAYVASRPSEWVMKDIVEDVVFEYANDYRVIQTHDTVSGKETKVVELKIKMDNSKEPNKIEFPYPCTLGFAVEKTNVQMPPNTLATAGAYRKRTRRSFEKLGTDGKILIRVDMTVVSYHKDAIVTQISYEIEVEAIGPFDLLTTDANGLTVMNETQQAMSDTMELLLRINTQTKHLYNWPMRHKVISEINRAFDPKVENVTLKILDKLINKPIPLQWKDLEAGREDSLFPTSTGVAGSPRYAVTIKADGERIFIYWNRDGVWLFNPFARVLNLIWNQEVPDMTGYMIDGEILMTGTAFSQIEYKVLVFDCLRGNSENYDYVLDIRKLPLSERLKAARYAAKYTNAHPVGLKLEVKVFYPFWDRESFFLANSRALRMNKDHLNNEIFKSDGLIFTDTGEYIFEGYVSDNQDRSRNRKFKPVELLTIDFLIDTNKDSQMIIMAGRSVNIGGNREAKMVPFTGDSSFQADPTNIDTTFFNSNGKKVSIEVGQIVEFRWDKERKIFTPTRIREDRSEPNGYKIALDNWKLIIDPIPHGTLTNKLRGRKILKLQSQYVNRVKTQLLNDWSSITITKLQGAGDRSRPRLLDMGSGKGGDVGKWKQCNFDVIAIEPDASSNGLLELEERANKAGISSRIQTVNIGVDKSEAILNKFQVLGIKKVDVVSSFHMMTFLYESAKMVDGFIKTVTGTLKKGGVLLIMAMDGLLIHRQLGENMQASIEGIKIQRSKNDPRKVMIRMNVKDERLIRGQTEYLVDFDDLITRLEASGFELINDNYLNSGIALNDTELWWSQMTRVLELRYVGAGYKHQSKRLETLNEIMKTALNFESGIRIDEARQFPIEMVDNFTGMGDLYTLGVLGGGSCFLHSILWSRSQRYRDLNHSERIAMVVQLRKELAESFTISEYNSLANGNIAELGRSLTSRQDNSYSFRVLTAGLRDYGHWFGLEFVVYVSNQLNLNIHLVWLVEDQLEVYQHGPDLNTTFKQERHNVILYWQGGSHFQPVGRGVGDDIAFLFGSDDPLIQQIVKPVEQQ